MEYFTIFILIFVCVFMTAAWVLSCCENKKLKKENKYLNTLLDGALKELDEKEGN